MLADRAGEARIERRQLTRAAWRHGATPTKDPRDVWAGSGVGSSARQQAARGIRTSTIAKKVH